jgi:nitrate/nitrite-specific signal transduction histidine kinase
MRKRIESISGTMELESLPGSGTRVKLMIKLDTRSPRPEKIRACSLSNPSP